jgi:heat shock protein HslJ
MRRDAVRRDLKRPHAAGLRAPGLVTLLAALGILLAGCASPADDGGPDPQLRGQWELTSASDSAGQLDLSNQHITLTIGGDTSTSGRGACSSYTAQLFGSIDALWVRAELPGHVDCGSQIQLTLEQRYMAALQAVRSGSVDGGVLELTSPDATLRFARSLARPVDQLVDRLWKLTGMSSVNFFDARIDETDPIQQSTLGAELRFGANGDLTGHLGCEDFTASWAQNAGEIVVSHLATSLKVVPCPSSPSSPEGVTTDVLKVINTSFTFRTSTNELILVSSRAGIALFFGLSG